MQQAISSNTNQRNELSSSILPNVNLMRNMVSPQSNQSQQEFEQKVKRIFALNPIEEKNEFEEKMCHCYLVVQKQMLCKTDNQFREELVRISYDGSKSSEEIILGLAVSMLLSTTAPQIRSLMTTILTTRDGPSQLPLFINQILTEHYNRLSEESQTNLLTICKELLRTHFPNIENIFYNLIRNIVSGDISAKNLKLLENILDILIENQQWYEDNIQMLQFVLFKYLRLIADHNQQHSCFGKEVKFCNNLLRKHFPHFISIGRDLIRLLLQIARIQEFSQIWKDILTNPSNLAPNFNLINIMKTRTPKKFIRLLVTVDAEKKLSFLITNVRFVNLKRHQDWLFRQYLSNDQHQMIRIDFIRYICTSIHPSNDILAADYIPRWAVIGALLTNYHNQVVISLCKLTLFYDWLFFDINDLNNNLIMDLEPGLLLMNFSLKNYPPLTASLLDFLYKITIEFYPPLTQQIKHCICNSFKYQIDKRVIANLSFIMDHKIDQQLRSLFTKTFTELQPLIDIIPMSGNVIYQMADGQQPVPITNGQPNFFPSTQIPAITTSCSAFTSTNSNNNICQQVFPSTSNTTTNNDTCYQNSVSTSCTYSTITTTLSSSALQLSYLNNNNISSCSSSLVNNSIVSGTSSFSITTSSSETCSLITTTILPSVRLLPSSVVVVSASHAAASIGQSLTRNTNPILTNIKPINVVKQISSCPLKTTTIGNNNEQMVNVVTTNIYSQSPPISNPTLGQSRFSDDEDENSDSAQHPNSSIHSKILNTKKTKKSDSEALPSSLSKVMVSSLASKQSSSANNSSAFISTNTTLIQPISSTISNTISVIPQTVEKENNISEISNAYLSHANTLDNQKNKQLHFKTFNSTTNINNDDNSNTMTNNNNASGKESDQSTFLNMCPTSAVINKSTNNETNTSSSSSFQPYTTTTSVVLEPHLMNNSIQSSIIDAILPKKATRPSLKLTDLEITKNMEQINNESIKASIEILLDCKEQKLICEVMKHLMGELIKYPSECNFINNLAAILLSILDEDLSQNRFSKNYGEIQHFLEPDLEMLNSSIEGPLFVIFECLVEFTRGNSKDNNRNEDNNPFKYLVTKLAAKESQFGFLLLHYLIVSDNIFDCFVVYRDLIQATGKEIIKTLLSDLENCAVQEYYMFYYILPEVLKAFSILLHGNIDFISILLLNCDYKAMTYLISLVSRKVIKFIQPDELVSVVNASSSWDLIQQNMLWDLMIAHDYPPELYLSIYKDESAAKNENVFNNLFRFMRNLEPKCEYLKIIISRPKHGNVRMFVIQLLLTWANKYEKTLIDVIGNYVSWLLCSPNKRNKRASNLGNKANLTDHLLYYLDQMRLYLHKDKNETFFNQEFASIVLYQLKQICNMQQRCRHPELFTNVPDDGDSTSALPRRTTATTPASGRKNQNKKQQQNLSNNNNSETESDSSEEETPQRVQKSHLRNKKRKHQSGFESD